MRIAIDAGPLSDGNSGRGIGVYTKLLSEALITIASNHRSNIDLIDIHNAQDLSIYDVVHYPYFDFFKNTLKVPQRTPVIVTIHDAIPLIYPKQYPLGVKGTINLFRQKNTLKRAKIVITDSNTSKKDIVRFLNIKENMIVPIYLGTTILGVQPAIDVKKLLIKHGIEFPYVLYIGDVNWNKNLVSLAEACESAKLHLVIIGKKAISTNFDKNHIENMPLLELQSKYGNSEYIHRIGFILDEELPVLIKKAILLCQPSYYEGFGLSVLDAMSLGTPTVCARTQALVEIYGDSTVYFDPYNISEMSSVLKSVFTSKNLQSKLSKKGETLSQKFSWEKTAQKTFEIYQKVLNTK